jgi:1-acyl-sn-glycerol-3-phosphate acyltransferase
VTTGQIARFNQDNFQLAANLGVPIVPLYIEIPREIDPGKGFDARPGTVRVHVQPTISTEGWAAEGLASSTATIRDAFVRIHRERHA